MSDAGTMETGGRSLKRGGTNRWARHPEETRLQLTECASVKDHVLVMARKRQLPHFPSQICWQSHPWLQPLFVLFLFQAFAIPPSGTHLQIPIAFLSPSPRSLRIKNRASPNASLESFNRRPSPNWTPCCLPLPILDFLRGKH